MRAGDLAREAWIVLDGMLELQDEDGARVGFLARGDVFGDAEALRHARTAVSLGGAFLLATPREVIARVGGGTSRWRREARGRSPPNAIYAAAARPRA